MLAYLIIIIFQFFFLLIYFFVSKSPSEHTDIIIMQSMDKMILNKFDKMEYLSNLKFKKMDDYSYCD